MRKTQRHRVTAAGMLFANETHVLAGYQARKVPSFLSGFGGMRKPGESMLDCAFRETVEELFEVLVVPENLLQRLKRTLPRHTMIRHRNFMMFVYTFSDLENFLRCVSDFGMESPIYDGGLPHCLMDLMFYRRIPEDTHNVPEITQLCLLPLVQHPSNHPFVAPHFVQEMARILEERKSHK
jgi:8-oxo-dGTP pyrophosphatase MutT (NUDIX family)